MKVWVVKCPKCKGIQLTRAKKSKICVYCGEKFSPKPYLIFKNMSDASYAIKKIKEKQIPLEKIEQKL